MAREGGGGRDKGRKGGIRDGGSWEEGKKTHILWNICWKIIKRKIAMSGEWG